jgi:uncharacterized protein
MGKRLVKSPKIYVADSGLACHLLGIDTMAELAKSPFAGALFEGFIASEIVKRQANSGRRRELYYFRDEQGLEVDFLFPGRSGRVSMIECQAGKTVSPAMAKPMLRLAEAWGKKRSVPLSRINMLVVHQPPKTGSEMRTLAQGVQALSWRDFLATLPE